MDDRPDPVSNPYRKPLSCWIVTEGLAGTENQCIGVAEALDIPVEIKRIRLNNPWKTFSPYLGFEGNFTFSPALLPPWPDLLLTSGRKSIAAARFIKRQSSGRTVTVHLQDPRISAHHFDLVAVPAHDSLRAENVIVTAAAPLSFEDVGNRNPTIKYKVAIALCSVSHLVHPESHRPCSNPNTLSPNSSKSAATSSKA